jgi:hypothetical protein
MNDTTIGIICAVVGALVLLSARRGLGLQARLTSFLFRRTYKDRLLYWAKWIVGIGLLAFGLLLLAGMIDLNRLRR